MKKTFLSNIFSLFLFAFINFNMICWVTAENLEYCPSFVNIYCSGENSNNYCHLNKEEIFPWAELETYISPFISYKFNITKKLPLTYVALAGPNNKKLYFLQCYYETHPINSDIIYASVFNYNLSPNVIGISAQPHSWYPIEEGFGCPSIHFSSEPIDTNSCPLLAK